MPVAAAALAGPSQNDATPAATPAARKVLPVRQPSASAQVSVALAAVSVRPQAIHQPDMAAAKITATGSIDRMPCACMVALAMSTKKPTAEMAEPIWGARPAAAPIAIAAMTRPGSAATPAVCISKKLKVPHVSAEIARMV